MKHEKSKKNREAERSSRVWCVVRVCRFAPRRKLSMFSWQKLASNFCQPRAVGHSELFCQPCFVCKYCISRAGKSWFCHQMCWGWQKLCLNFCQEGAGPDPVCDGVCVVRV